MAAILLKAWDKVNQWANGSPDFEFIDYLKSIDPTCQWQNPPAVVAMFDALFPPRTFLQRPDGTSSALASTESLRLQLEIEREKTKQEQARRDARLAAMPQPELARLLQVLGLINPPNAK